MTRTPPGSLILAAAIAAAAASRASGAVDLHLAPRFSEAMVLGTPREILLGDPASELLLRRGWAVAETWPGELRASVWADAPASELRIWLAAPRPLRLLVEAAPLHCGTCPPQTMALEVNGHPVGRAVLPSGGFRTHAFVTPAAVWRHGDNTLRFAWGWQRRPGDLDASSRDRRSLAASVSRVVLEDRDGTRAPRVEPAAEGDRMLVPAARALAFHVRLPEDAGSVTLRGSVAREGVLSAPAAAGTARVVVTADGRPAATLAEIALAGLGDAPRSFTCDLSGYGGEAVRLGLCVEGRPGLVARWDGVALSLPDHEEAASRALGTFVPRGTVVAGPGAAEPRSVVLYLMDALRARDLGCYGSPRVTSPFVDALSRRGRLWEENVTQAPNTPPSVKALLTGMYLPLSGFAPLPPEHLTLGEMFRAAGHRTGAFSNTPWPAAIGALRGMEHVAPGLAFEEGRSKEFAAALAASLAAWVDERPGAPFFAYAHAIHPHNPYAPPEPWRSPASVDGSTKRLLDAQHGTRALGAAELDGLSRLYGEDILYADHTIAWLAARLRAAGAWERTIFALVSDHGDELGEHGGLLHGWTPFSEMIEVPVVLHGPGVPEGWRRGRSENVDVAPTLLSLAGVSVPPGLHGRADAPGAALHRAHCSASSAPGIYTLLMGPHKYVYAPRNGQEVGIGEGTARVHERFYLYELEADPRETQNVVHERPVLAEHLHRALESWLQATGGAASRAPATDPCAGCDEETRRVLKQLGYLE